MIVISTSVHTDLTDSIAAGIGPDAEILSSISEENYRRWSAGGFFTRLLLRLIGWFGHPLRLVVRLLLSPPGTIFVVTTNPFFAPALAVRFGRWRGRSVVHHVFDLYPDALEAAGSVPRDGRRSRVIAALTRYVQRDCAGAVYLGDALQQHAEQRHGRAANTAVIEVTADESLFDASDAMATEQLTVHYGGQLGRMHDAAPLVEAVRRLRPEREAGRVRFDFRVGGARAAHLIALADEPGVTVGPVLPAPQWRQAIRGMQVGLVSLRPEGAHVCMPSKTYALLAGGLALIAVAPASSDLAGVVREKGVGWVIENSPGPGDRSEADRAARLGEEIAVVVRRLLQNPAETQARRRAARAAACGQFGREVIAGKWQNFLVKLS